MNHHHSELIPDQHHLSSNAIILMGDKYKTELRNFMNDHRNKRTVDQYSHISSIAPMGDKFKKELCNIMNNHHSKRAAEHCSSISTTPIGDNFATELKNVRVRGLVRRSKQFFIPGITGTAKCLSENKNDQRSEGGFTKRTEKKKIQNSQKKEIDFQQLICDIQKQRRRADLDREVAIRLKSDLDENRIITLDDVQERWNHYKNESSYPMSKSVSASSFTRSTVSSSCISIDTDIVKAPGNHLIEAITSSSRENNDTDHIDIPQNRSIESIASLSSDGFVHVYEDESRTASEYSFANFDNIQNDGWENTTATQASVEFDWDTETWSTHQEVLQSRHRRPRKYSSTSVAYLSTFGTFD